MGVGTVFTEKKYRGEAIASEANGTRSRENVIFAMASGVVPANAVLGKITVGTASAAAVAGNTGNGTMGAITVSAGAKAGVYTLVIIEPGTNVGTFEVEGPDGILIGTGNVAAAFSKGGLAFTLADGATDFVSGDSFKITVAAGSGKYVIVNPSATDGSQIAAAVSVGAVDVTVADVVAAAVVRSAELRLSDLDFGTLNSGQIITATAQLVSVALIVRTGV